MYDTIQGDLLHTPKFAPAPDRVSVARHSSTLAGRSGSAPTSDAVQIPNKDRSERCQEREAKLLAFGIHSWYFVGLPGATVNGL